VLPSQSLLRVPTLEQSQLAQTLRKRLISKPGTSFPLSSSASFSAARTNYRKHKYLESANASESIPDVSSDSQTSQLLCSERKLSETSITDTECRKSTIVSEQECSLQRKAANHCKCDQDSRMITEGFPACSKSLNACQGCEDLVHVNGRQQYCSLHTMDEILMTTEEETNISQNGHTALPLNSQLEENDGVSGVSIMRISVTLMLTLNMNTNKLRQQVIKN
jgi:hypothetical protein